MNIKEYFNFTFFIIVINLTISAFIFRDIFHDDYDLLL